VCISYGKLGEAEARAVRTVDEGYGARTYCLGWTGHAAGYAGEVQGLSGFKGSRW
jgi:hypothetical protein